MRKLFLVLTVAGILAAPTVVTEAAEPTQDRTVVAETTRSRGTENPAREEERLLREAKRVVREIYKAQRTAKKAERTEVSAQLEALRLQRETADRETRKALRAEISNLRENREFDSMDEFLDNMTLVYDDNTAKSEGYVVSISDIRKNLNATVTYNSKTRTLTLTKDKVTVTVTLDADGAYVGGEVLYIRGDKQETEEVE